MSIQPAAAVSSEYAVKQKKKSGSNSSVGASALPLSMVDCGSEVYVRYVRGKEDIRHFLSTLGFVEDALCTVVSELNGNVIVNIKDTRIAISKVMASKILTSPVSFSS